MLDVQTDTGFDHYLPNYTFIMNVIYYTSTHAAYGRYVASQLFQKVNAVSCQKYILPDMLVSGIWSVIKDNFNWFFF